MGEREYEPIDFLSKHDMQKEIQKLTTECDRLKESAEQKDEFIVEAHVEIEKLKERIEELIENVNQSDKEHMEAEAECDRLKEENKVLLDCINGSSKAEYSAEAFDLCMAEWKSIADNLTGFAEHPNECGVHHGSRCSCGLDELLNAVKGE